MKTEELYEQYFPVARRIARGYTRNSDEAEDFAQEACLKLVRNYRENKEGIQNIDYWSKKVIKNKILDFVRHNRSKSIFSNHRSCDAKEIHERKVFDESEEALGYEKFVSSNFSNIMDEIKKLSPVYKKCMEYYYIDGYNSVEIGKMLGIGEVTVRTNLMKARNKIKKKLGSPVLI